MNKMKCFGFVEQYPYETTNVLYKYLHISGLNGNKSYLFWSSISVIPVIAVYEVAHYFPERILF